MKLIKLDGRLSSVAELVRQGAVFADIGTDHGYLPLYLLENEIISFAYLSDINEGPLLSAKANAEKEGLLDRCEFFLSDGLSAIPRDTVTDIAICGMGGELIVKIIDEAREISRVGGVRLLLQPMSRPEVLREYLYREGYRIIDERYSEAGKFYITILAEYTGECEAPDTKTLHFGKEEYLLPLNNATRGYLSTRLRALTREVRGRELGGLDDGGIPTLIDYLNKILEN